MNNIKRIFVQKKDIFDTESIGLSNELATSFGHDKYKVKVLNIYDIDNYEGKEVEGVISKILSSKNTDIIVDIDFNSKKMFAMEFLPGQYDQRSDRAVQSAALLNPETKIRIRSGKLFIFENDLDASELDKVKKYIINPIECREKDLSILSNELSIEKAALKKVDGFTNMSNDQLKELFDKMSLAMTFDDFVYIQGYYANEEKRDPSETEIKMLDTYWSDHCRHTTFETEIENIKFSDDAINSEIQKDLKLYKSIKENVSSHKPVTLMDIATSLPKHLIKTGKMDDVEISAEINACTILRNVDVDGEDILYSIQFKNETHNHPTEIEPFGGASTCLGGAIRDPLSGRAYVYQGMRITGAGDITEDISKTIPGKLHQKKITKSAAHGFSSYGNEIGMSTTLVKEIFHEGYKAKRMEVGAVVGANPADFIQRTEPSVGDLIILIGGRTGRDGIGGATGSSKKHNAESVETASSEVQKGNAPEERKIQRLFRNPDLTRLIKKSNDFGAGGLSVAVGEIADSIEIYSERVPLKYDGMNAHEITLSESQERMAVVIDPSDLNKVIELSKAENLEATHIATVTDNNRLIVKHNDDVVVNISRAFLETNGVRQKSNALITGNKSTSRSLEGNNISEKFLNNLKDLNVSSQKGLIEMFDFSIGNTTVLAPFGGVLQNSPTQVSVQKVPVMDSKTNTVTMMSYGYNPYISESSPYLGAMYAVLESISKIVSAGGKTKDIRFSFQEYFERLGNDESKWGKPLAALLGAYRVQNVFEAAAIGGKDSMSGTFEEITVPPTLISFALTTAKADEVISTDFKEVNNNIYLLKVNKDANGLPMLDEAKENFLKLEKLISDKKVVSAFSLEHGGIAEAIAKMSFGTKLGFDINTDEDLFEFNFGSIVFESKEELEGFTLIGKTSNGFKINGEELNKDEAVKAWEKTFDKVFVREQDRSNEIKEETSTQEFETVKPLNPTDSPKVFIPVFPGTNCEYDMQRKFAREGAICKQVNFRNMTSSDIVESTQMMAKEISESDIFVLAGGFSASDEPDGSGKFIASILSAPVVKKAIEKHLEENKLIIGICNGFQALVRSGLLPFGKFSETTDESPILFRNDINRHVAKYIRTKVTTTKGPWLNGFEVNETHQIPISHGEGRFVVNDTMLQELIKKDMIAFQYVDDNDKITMEGKYNPNGSTYAIEGIVSENGLILGKMGHSERYEENICKNIYGNKDQNVFVSAVKYFRGK